MSTHGTVHTSSSPTRRKLRRIAPILAALLTLAVLDRGCQGILYPRHRIIPARVKGVVVDSLTGAPIPGATVIGSVWVGTIFDASPRKVERTTDAKGRFTILHWDGHRVDIEAIADGYHGAGSPREIAGPVQLALVPLRNPLRLEEISGRATSAVGEANGGWSLARGQAVRPDEGPDFHVTAAKNGDPTLVVNGEAGFVAVSGLPRFHELDNMLEAPADGYLPTLPARAAWGPTTGVWVRDATGKRYGKMNIWSIGQVVAGTHRTASVLFTCYFNPDGSRNVETYPPSPFVGRWFRELLVPGSSEVPK